MHGTISAKVVSGGRVTLDSEIRHELNIDIGDYVVLRVHPLESLVSDGSKRGHQEMLKELTERNNAAEQV